MSQPCTFGSLKDVQHFSGCNVSKRSFWDGQIDCKNGKDECPRFYYSEESTENRLMRSKGVSGVNHIIENISLKVESQIFFRVLIFSRIFI